LGVAGKVAGRTGASRVEGGTTGEPSRRQGRGRWSSPARTGGLRGPKVFERAEEALFQLADFRQGFLACGRF
jgi:hypothetical protein